MAGFGSDKVYEITGENTEWEDILIKKGITTQENVLLSKGINPEEVILSFLSFFLLLLFFFYLVYEKERSCYC